ncbi:MAG: hypothetical protein RTU92_02755 [Candidatus Thorarchaeota archaeon]
MSGAPPDTPHLDALKTECAEVTIPKNAHLTLVSSPYPDALFSTALMCRAALKSRRLFQVTYAEPVITTENISALLKKRVNSIHLLMGIQIVGRKKPEHGKYPPILVGGGMQSKSTKIPTLSPNASISAVALALASANLESSDEELQLAAIGTLLQLNQDQPINNVDKEIIDLATAKGLLDQQSGLRLFGNNSLSIVDALFYSIHPILPEITGNRDSCNQIIEDAEVPLSKRSLSLSTLTSDETQQLNEQIIQKLLLHNNPSIISVAIGTDTILLQELEDSPLRYLSSINALVHTSWTRRQFGESLSVWIGDRARMLRSFQDSYMIHCKDVIAGIERLTLRLTDQDFRTTDDLDTAIISPMGIPIETLPDIGRIAFDAGLIGTQEYIILSSESSTEFIWKSATLKMNTVMQSLIETGLDPISTSQKSIRILDISEQTVDILLKAIRKLRSSD